MSWLNLANEKQIIEAQAAATRVPVSDSYDKNEDGIFEYTSQQLDDGRVLETYNLDSNDYKDASFLYDENGELIASNFYDEEGNIVELSEEDKAAYLEEIEKIKEEMCPPEHLSEVDAEKSRLDAEPEPDKGGF